MLIHYREPTKFEEVTNALKKARESGQYVDFIELSDQEYNELVATSDLAMTNHMDLVNNQRLFGTPLKVYQKGLDIEAVKEALDQPKKTRTKAK